jgi:hypothetical protein
VQTLGAALTLAGAALLVISANAAAPPSSRFRLEAAPHEEQRFCVAQASVGDDEAAAARGPRGGKRAYASRNGYGFVDLEAATLRQLVAHECPAIAAAARHSDARAAKALCALRAAADAGCEWTLYVDAAAEVVDGGAGLEDLLDASSGWAASTVWFLVDGAARPAPSGPVGGPERFAGTLDLSALLARGGSDFVATMTDELLAIANESDFLASASCRGQSNATAANASDVADPCASPATRAECALGCLTRMHPNWLDERTSVCLRSSRSDDEPYLYLDDGRRPPPYYRTRRPTFLRLAP